MENFGKKIAFMRSQKNLGIQALAELAGVSRSTIYKLEKNQMQPTLELAMKLAKALDTPLSKMLHELENQSAIELIKQGEHKQWQLANSKRQLIAHLTQQINNAEWLKITLPANNDTGQLPAFDASESRYFHILSGSMILTHNQEKFTLDKGDTLLTNELRDFTCTNPNNEDCEFMLLILK